MKYSELKELLLPQAEICRDTLPGLANKPDNEKTLDDKGLEFLMSGCESIRRYLMLWLFRMEGLLSKAAR